MKVCIWYQHSNIRTSNMHTRYQYVAFQSNFQLTRSPTVKYFLMVTFGFRLKQVPPSFPSCRNSSFRRASPCRLQSLSSAVMVVVVLCIVVVRLLLYIMSQDPALRFFNVPVPHDTRSVASNCQILNWKIEMPATRVTTQPFLRLNSKSISV